MYFIKYFTIFFAFLSVDCLGEKLIIDTDAGVDDATAILLLLRSEYYKVSNYQVIAVTCVQGNTKEKNVEKNVLTLLSLINRTDIPVYSGAKKPIIGDFHGDGYFGQNGFNDVDISVEITSTVDRSMHAALALINLAKKNSGNLSIVAFGPLTNIALAITLDENFINNINNLYILGGSVAGVGNIRPNVEFNFAGDPEGVFITLNSSKTPDKLIIFPWETSLNLNISKEWRKNILGSINSRLIKFLNKIESRTLSLMNSKWGSADAFLACFMIQPEIVQNYIKTNIEAVIDGKARGSILVDYKFENPNKFNAVILQSVDEKMIMNILLYLLR